MDVIFIFIVCMAIGAAIRERVSESNTINLSKNFPDKYFFDSSGKRYLNGKCVLLTWMDGNQLLMDAKTGQILRNFTLEEMEKISKKMEDEWNLKILNAKKDGKNYFEFFHHYYKNGFACTHPSGLYETDSLKRYELYKFGNKYYKVYYKQEPNPNGKYCMFKFVLDYENKKEISETEWIALNGNVYGK